jgi:hypothetical protein
MNAAQDFRATDFRLATSCARLKAMGSTVINDLGVYNRVTIQIRGAIKLSELVVGQSAEAGCDELMRDTDVLNDFLEADAQSHDSPTALAA